MEVNKTKQTKTKNGRGKGKRAGNRAGGIKGEGREWIKGRKGMVGGIYKKQSI